MRLPRAGTKEALWSHAGDRMCPPASAPPPLSASQSAGRSLYICLQPHCLPHSPSPPQGPRSPPSSPVPPFLAVVTGMPQGHVLPRFGDGGGKRLAVGGCRQGKILPLLKGCAQTEPGSYPCFGQKGGRSCACVPPPYWGRQGGFLLCLTTSRWHKNGHLGLGDAVNSPGDPTFAPTQTQHSHRQSFQPVYCTGARMGLGVCGCVCVFPVFSSPSVLAHGWRLVPQRFPFLARPGRRKIIFPFVSRFPRPFGLEAAWPEPGPAPSLAGRSVLRCGFRPAAPCLALPRCRESLGARFPCRCFPGAVG